MKTYDSPELAATWLEYQRHKHDHPELYRLKSTGLLSLDTALGGGLEPGQYVVVGGAQKSGKTTLLSCMTESFAKQGMKVLFMSGEMTSIQNANLFFSRMTMIDRTRIRAVNLDERDWVKLEKAAEELSQYGIWWNHGFSTITDIDTVMNEMEKKNEITFDAVIVDYIQLMEAPETKGRGNRVQELEYISRNLKRRSLERGKPLLVVIASQLNRSSIRGNIYDANSFLGSGSIERDMDVGLIIKSAFDPISAAEKKDAKEISIVGSRETESGNVVTCYYNGKIAMLSDVGELVSKDMFGRY